MGYSERGHELLAQQNAKQKKVREVFEDFCGDNGQLEEDEVLALLEELGMLKNLKTERTEYLAKCMLKYDKDGDGDLDFEEFKKFYNEAIDNANGKSLSSETMDARQKIKEESLRKKAEAAEKVRQQNVEMKKKIEAQNKGRDSKELDNNIKERRKQLQAEKRAKKEAEAKRIEEENKRMKIKIKSTGAAVDHDLLDDQGGAVAAQRNKLAADGGAKRAKEKAAADQSAKDLAHMAKNTASRTDHDVLDDQGGAVAANRDALKAEGEAKRAKEKAAADQSAKDLAYMAQNTASRTDHDVLDDQGGAVAANRDALKAEGEAKRAKEKAAADQSANDLAYMAQNTASVIDDRDNGRNF